MKSEKGKKRKIAFVIGLMMTILSLAVTGCSKQTNSEADNSPTEYILRVTNTNVSDFDMTKDEDGSYTVTLVLDKGDELTICDNKNNVYKYADSEFDGVIKEFGEYTFKLEINAMGATLHVTPPHKDDTSDNPNDNPTDNPNDNTEDKPVDKPTDNPGGGEEKPRDTVTTVYYTDSENWGKVYAYMWNSLSGAKKTGWPGERLSSCGVSRFGETQYSIKVDFGKYDRIIFNDGSGNNEKQTKDLVVGYATSGYYGKDGIFTMDTEKYGEVEYFKLKDQKNLSYIDNATKKISVYTPSGYTPQKKYGVLYMFDSQNLYAKASGLEESDSEHEAWAVDVAVTNAVKNGSDGIIIVAIDNTDGYRDSELTMSRDFGTLTNLADNQAFYNGKLDDLGNFMKETLMPWVKSHYSVDTSVSKTGIAGSSSGGLAAYYLGLRDNDLYGYIGALSPANGLFTQNDWTRFYNKKNFGDKKPKVYVYCGKNGDGLENMLLPAAKEIKRLTEYGFKADSIIENYAEGAMHNESYWRIVFTDFLGKML